MIILRKCFSNIDEEQREFANKYNKELKRKWQMEQGYNKTIKGDFLPTSKSKRKIELDRLTAAKNSNTLPGEGSKAHDVAPKEVKKIANRQELLLERGRETDGVGREFMQRRRGEKKVKGAKQVVNNSAENMAWKKQELMKKANDRGVTRAQIAERIAKRKEAEAQKLAQKTTQQAAQQTTQKATQTAAKKGLEKVTNNKQVKEGMAKRAMGWVKKNPKLAGGSALGAALGTGAILGYRQYKKNKEN